MKIDCYISEGCPSEKDLAAHISLALQLESVAADLRIHVVNDREAKEHGLMGSPSIMIDGRDILPGEIPGIS